MSQQLDIFAPLIPPPTPYIERPRVEVKTRAFQHGGIITLYGDDPMQPFEIVVRGIECVISDGFCTHAIFPPGSPFWSETGFRSFGYPTDDPEEIEAAIERYIHAPAKYGNGCAGKLTPWWPFYVLQWRQSLAFELSMGDRANVWDQWGPEKHEDHWHRHDMKLADAIEQMREEGIDPNDVGPPAGFRGKWPKVAA